MRNEIKIRFEEPEYEVNSEKGTVECFLRYEVLYPDFLQSIYFYGEKIFFFSKAIAKVNEGDVFDENIGKKISLAKAEKKAYRKISNRIYKQIGQKVVKAVKIASDFVYKAKKVSEHNDKYLEQWK
jgi:hypothetical protein